MNLQKGLAIAHSQKPAKMQELVMPVVSGYVCLRIILKQMDSARVCSVPCVLGSCSLMEPWGAPPRPVLLILMIFFPFHTLWFLGVQWSLLPQPGCFYAVLCETEPHSLAISLYNDAPALQNKFRA